MRIFRQKYRDNEKLCRDIRKEAKARGLDAKDIAEAAGIDAKQARAILAPKGEPTAPAITSVAAYLWPVAGKPRGFVGSAKYQVATSKHYVEFHDQKHDVWRRCPGFTDKKATEQLGAKLEKLAGYAANGTELDPDLRAWLDAATPAMLDRLLKWGLVDRRRAATSKPLHEHVEDYAAHLDAAGHASKHATQTRTRLLRLLERADVRWWTELSASRIQTAIGSMTQTARVPDPERPGRLKHIQVPVRTQTKNHALTVAKAFCNWMVADGRATTSPITSLRRQAVTDSRQKRAPSVNELRRLIAAAQAGESFRWGGGRGRFADRPEHPHAITGPERALLYRLAVETGLRSSELRSLTRQSFDLDTRPARVTVQSGYTKNKREATIALRPELAELLRQHLAHKAPAAQAINVPPDASKMMRRDLAVAGIAHVDEQGRVLNFHALRHGFITAVGRSGVSARTVQELARHQSITTTMRYLHTTDEEKQAAINALPALPPLDEPDAETA